MQKLNQLLFLGLLLISVTGCQTETSQDKTPPSAFFDLNGYFAEQMETVKTISCVKTVAIGEATNSDTLSGDRLFEDLKIFQQFDPNKPAWTEKYRRDTLLSATGKVKEIKYAALDAKLPTQSVLILFQDEEIKQVLLNIHKKNALYQFDQTLEYKPGQGYTIIKDQKVLFMSNRKYRINVAFIAT